jgi:flagellar basal body-associated protein FliL
MADKKTEKSSPSKKRIILLLLIAIILIAAVIFFIYIKFFDTGIQFSPEESVFSYDTSRSLVLALGQDGLDWFCGRSPKFTDSQGNEYGDLELSEFNRLINNVEQLKEELC